jgi:CubicO group peptidase (beta-lactamase class C family)
MMRRMGSAVAVLLGVLAVSGLGAEFTWQTATPESQGMSGERLRAMRESLAGRGTKALLVVRNDRIVYEWYAADHSAGKKHYTASMAKALVGGLGTALAMRYGGVKLDDPVAKYVPAWRDDPAKAGITIRELGSHTSGLEDAVPKDEGGWKQAFWERKDPPRDPFTLARDEAPLVSASGTRFAYSNPGIAMLGYALTAALRKAPEKDLRTLLRERVMRPIGVADEDWSVGYGQTFAVDGLPVVAPWGGGGFTARAAARVGRLVLRRGYWEGRTVLPPETVRLTTEDAGLPGGNGIGWWTNARSDFPELPRDAVYALGAEHQILLIVPSLGLVCVRNGGALAPREPREGYERARGKNLFTPLMEAVIDVDPAERKAPYPPSEIISGVEFDFTTHRRFAPGSDNFQLTWADDGHQYAPWGDGGGFSGTNGDGRVSLGVARVEGEWDDYAGFNVWGGKNAENAATFGGKSWGMVGVDGALYMWVSQKSALSAMQAEARLYRSADHGANWEPAEWAFTKADRLAIPTICQFGRGYDGARDEYVYHYFIDPVAEFLFARLPPGRVWLARSPKDRLMEREAYEFFAGVDERGKPRWTADVARKRAVFEDRNGTGWNLSVSYNRGLGRYVLMTEHVITSQGNLGMFEAPEPWGPWRTAAYRNTAAGTQFGRTRVAGNAFFWNMPTKWQSEDGREFTLVFTGAGQGSNNDSWNTVRGRFR